MNNALCLKDWTVTNVDDDSETIREISARHDIPAQHCPKCGVNKEIGGIMNSDEKQLREQLEVSERANERMLMEIKRMNARIAVLDRLLEEERSKRPIKQ